MLPAHGWAQGDDQILPPGTPFHQAVEGRGQNPGRDPAPAGMTGRGMAGAGISDQHRGAVGTAHPEALAPGSAHQTITLRPGFAAGLVGVEHDAAVHLLRAVHADASADVTGQFVGASTLPASCEESVLKTRFMQTVALQVIPPVATDPGPALQGVEAVVGAIERIPAFHRYGS